MLNNTFLLIEADNMEKLRKFSHEKLRKRLALTKIQVHASSKIWHLMRWHTRHKDTVEQVKFLTAVCSACRNQKVRY
jgi:hypothetical protein